MRHLTDPGMQATARAHPNIALIKYWGKRDTGLNLPAVDSLSLTLSTLYTDMRVIFDPSLGNDQLQVNGEPDDSLRPRVSRCLDAVAGVARPPALIDSHSNFPLGAGLASSASAFAALVVATAAAAERDLGAAALANLAGGASGSAARSLYGGIVLLRNAGDEVRAETVAAPGEWPLEVVIAITDPGRKAMSSGAAMEASRLTSPFYGRWVDEQPGDIEAALDAVSVQDFAALARVAEHNCLKMHSVMWTSRPPAVFWNAATVRCLETIRALQSDGVDVFFTIDAGPQVKAICTPGGSARVRDALQATDGVQAVLSSGLGSGAELVATC